MRICFIARPPYDNVSPELSIRLKCMFIPDLTTIFITSDSDETDAIRRHTLGWENCRVIEVTEYFKVHWEEFTYEKFKEYEKEYECAPIWKYIYMDRFLINAPYDYCIKIVAGYFQFWNYVFQEVGVDYYIDEAISTAHTAIAYIVGSRRGVKYLSMIAGRGELETIGHYWCNDFCQHMMKIKGNMVDGADEHEIYAIAERILTRYEKEDVTPGGFAQVSKYPRLNLKNTLLLLPRYARIRIKGKYDNRFFYMYYKQHGQVFYELRRFFRYHRCRKFFKKADMSKKYIYFPLHFQPEASTIVCASKYEKQLYFIDSLAKSIPADTQIYVKEHMAFLGNRDYDFYITFSQYPNVVLIDPLTNSRELIKNAYAIATLTGTVGWEAMLLRKPVFIGGDIFYRDAPGVMGVEDIYQNYGRIMGSYKRPAREEVIEYVSSVLKHMNRGNAFVENETARTDDNYALLTKALYQVISQIEDNPGMYKWEI